MSTSTAASCILCLIFRESCLLRCLRSRGYRDGRLTGSRKWSTEARSSDRRINTSVITEDISSWRTARTDRGEFYLNLKKRQSVSADCLFFKLHVLYTRKAMLLLRCFKTVLQKIRVWLMHQLGKRGLTTLPELLNLYDMKD